MAAKLVGTGHNSVNSSSSTSVSITLSTSDWDYLEIHSFAVGQAVIYYSYNSNYEGSAAGVFDPCISYIYNG